MMLGEEEGKGEKKPSATTRRTYSRSASWSDRSPNNSSRNKPPRPTLPPLQPLSIIKRSAEEWPSAGSDDLGVWPLPQTPRGCSTNNKKDFQFKRDKLAFFDKECSRIAEHIYLGSDTVAKNHELLRQNRITHVLNCVGFVCPEYFKKDFVYKTLWLQDTPTEDITSILYDVFDYFEDVREQGGRVLVHCFQGVSRSTALVIAYLMWREGQSFEDAFQFVKTARGVTNPNMGFACQLLQCQKRVHAMPASPSSILRMYHMAPHSPYDPLHLVPKMVDQPGSQALDSRGAFIVHVPSAIYVWNGKHCDSVMSSSAKSAAFQVVRYERAKGPILGIHEEEEPNEFWVALSDKADGAMMEEEELNMMGIGPIRKVDAYDLDFEIFHKALAGGVVPPFSVSNMGSETCLPAREHGWARVRRKFASGVMKEFLTSSPKWNCDVIVEEEDKQDDSVVADDDPLSPDSFQCSPSSLGKAKDTIEDAMDLSDPDVVASSVLPLSPPCISNPFPSFLSSRSSPKFNSNKSPTLSPSSSDYASSFTFSPSSTNWSDLSFVSSRQPSPSGPESTEPFYVKDAVSNYSASSSSLFVDKEVVVSSPPSESFSTDKHNLGGADSYFLPLKGYSPSIAERRGSNPPPRMMLMLPSVNESSHVHKNLVRSQSFSLPDLDDKNVMKGDSCKQSDHEKNNSSSGVEPQSEIYDKEDTVTLLCNMTAELQVEEKSE